MMTQPTLMYTQPGMRPANPFGTNPGAQVMDVSIPLLPIFPIVQSLNPTFTLQMSESVLHFHPSVLCTFSICAQKNLVENVNLKKVCMFVICMTKFLLLAEGEKLMYLLKTKCHKVQ